MCRQHAVPLRALAARMAGCCSELADVLGGRRALKEALPSLTAMEAAYAELVGEVGASLQDAHGPPSSRAVHFNMILATLFTLCTRVGAGGKGGAGRVCAPGVVDAGGVWALSMVGAQGAVAAPFLALQRDWRQAGGPRWQCPPSQAPCNSPPTNPIDRRFGSSS